MNFDITALNAFRNFNGTTNDAIANFNSATGEVIQNGTYRGGFIGLFRVKKTENNNNAARTELLKALGSAFGLQGANTDDKGRVTFSKSFMASLEKLLGDDLMLKDFKIAADGTVSSGKPLTQRRINAIITRATIVGRGDFNVDTYKVKLNIVNDELAKIPDCKDAKAYFKHIGKCLDFIDKTLDTLIEENFYYDPNEAARDPNYNVPRFAFKKPDEAFGTPMTSRTPFVNYISSDQETYIGLFHFELYNLPKTLNTQEDVNALVGYVRSTIETYVQGAIDLFFDAKEAGKLDEFLNLASKPDACMDARAAQPETWRKELELQGDIVDFTETVTKHDTKTKLDDCIYEEMGVANKNIKGAKGWNDLADAVKKELVGKVRPIMTVANGQIKPLMKDGVQVVRAVTAEDVDALGPVCAQILGIF